MVKFLNFNVSLWHQTENIFKDNETKNARPFVHVVIHCGYKCWRHIREKKRITSVLELVLNFESLQCQIGPVLLYFDLLKLHCMMRLHCLSFKIFSVCERDISSQPSLNILSTLESSVSFLRLLCCFLLTGHISDITFDWCLIFVT